MPCGKDGQDVGGWDYESIAELTSEFRRQMPSKGGYSHYQWFKRPGRANYRLDCAVYALAALAMSRLRIDTCDVQRIEARELGREKSRTESGSTATLGTASRFGAINAA
jgi:phage terminase large subunit GpA-like protein